MRFGVWGVCGLGFRRFVISSIEVQISDFGVDTRIRFCFVIWIYREHDNTYGHIRKMEDICGTCRMLHTHVYVCKSRRQQILKERPQAWCTGVRLGAMERQRRKRNPRSLIPKQQPQTKGDPCFPSIDLKQVEKKGIRRVKLPKSQALNPSTLHPHTLTPKPYLKSKLTWESLPNLRQRSRAWEVSVGEDQVTGPE